MQPVVLDGLFPGLTYEFSGLRSDNVTYAGEFTMPENFDEIIGEMLIMRSIYLTDDAK